MVAESASQSGVELNFALGDDHFAVDIDERAVTPDAIYGASYLFLDRCFIHLSRSDSGSLRARLTTRAAATPDQLQELANEFASALAAQTTRVALSQSTMRLREYYLAAALRAAGAPPSVDDLLAELESEDLLEDPLEIMVPWEQKHGAKTDESGSK
jgi:His-Xaa-Ser system protein HxsD